MQHPLQWLAQRDRDLAALRRAGRAAIVMPAMFALGDKVIENAAVATFAPFGPFAMLLLSHPGCSVPIGVRFSGRHAAARRTTAASSFPDLIRGDPRT